MAAVVAIDRHCRERAGGPLAVGYRVRYSYGSDPGSNPEPTRIPSSVPAGAAGTAGCRVEPAEGRILYHSLPATRRADGGGLSLEKEAGRKPAHLPGSHAPHPRPRTTARGTHHRPKRKGGE
jgi:hypothetical protein